MNPLDDLANLFLKFPGIGKRQAKRFAYFIVQSPDSFTHQLAKQIQSVQKNTKIDPESFQYFYSENPNETRAPLMRDQTRDASVLMIIEKDVDIESLEKSKAFNGHYFVLGNLAPLIDSDLEHMLRLPNLLRIIELKSTRDNLREVIFALAANPEGDRTARLLKQKIEPLREQFGFKISQLGRGFSTGTEVEYSDPETLAHALENRK